MKEDMEDIIKFQKELRNYINNNLKIRLTEIQEKQASQQSTLTATKRDISAIMEQLDTREHVKRKCLHIVEAFIERRENVRAFESSKKKELAEQVRKQIQDI